MRHSKADSDSHLTKTFAVLLALLVAGLSTEAAGLLPATLAAFDRYDQLTQSRFITENTQLSSFLWIDGLPDARRSEAYAQLHDGQVVIERLETFDKGKSIPVPGGLIHHWIGTILIPGASVAQVLEFEQDYNHQQPYFSPDVIASRVLQHSGPDFTVEMRFRKKKIVTVILDTEHQVHYATIDSTHAWSMSRTVRIQEVDHPGEPDETPEPEGHDSGFLWRMNTYWRFEEKDGGTYVECQSISLTRDIPAGLGWLIGPYITSVPRESLTFTLAATRNAIMRKIGKNNDPN